MQAGSYTVTATVTDSGKGKEQRSSNCQASFAVNVQHPPTLAVSANPSSVNAGDPSAITADGNSPDNRPLTYSCTPTAGNLSGTGTHYSLDTTGVAPESTITINCTVTDDRNLTAAASTAVNINAAAAAVVVPPPPPQTEIEQYLNIRSIYFATDKPSIQKPEGGLLPSQEATLTKMASSFKTYLESKPDATLLLEGHCDPRGSVKYNQALSERRVERTKRLLIEQGVPEASLQTKAYGKQKNLTADQVKSAVEQNPEVSAEDKEKLLKNFRTILLASNRRVDVTLNVPGKSPQESAQMYPFNAEDSMVLLSQAPPSKKGGTKKKK
jgi:outer membrane protein OmpA-like peptidoglycan-associated protein